jgi:type IV fimbrial biogenesis protein FimT
MAATTCIAPHRHSAGFTLLEMIIVATVLFVLATIALPNYVQFVRNQRVKTASFDVFSTLLLARSEAVTRNTTVTVVPQSGTNDWTAGWRVTVGADTLRSQGALPNITLTGPTAVTYNGSGRLTAALASGIQITTQGTGASVRCITVDPSGRPVTKAQSC